MYKNFYNFNISLLLKNRLHLGHKDNKLNVNLTSYLYGIRHNINIYDLDKLWKPYRYLFYNLVHVFSKRNSFFIVGTNPNLPMSIFLENLLKEYPFQNKKNQAFYISGYMDKKWIGGLFTNWKIFSEFIQYLGNPQQKFKKKYRFQKYFYFLKGIENLFKMPIPDFVILLDKNEEALYELKKFQIPLIGLVDTNINPNDYIYPVFGNNDAMENIEFFFEFIKEAVKEGRLKEQQYFYYMFIHKLKKIIITQSKT